MCAAHATALLVCNSHFPLVQQDLITAPSVLRGLAAAIAQGPLAVGLDPALHTLFGQLWGNVALQVSGQYQRQPVVHLPSSNATAPPPFWSAVGFKLLCVLLLPGTAGQGLSRGQLAAHSAQRSAEPLPDGTPCIWWLSGPVGARLWAGASAAYGSGVGFMGAQRHVCKSLGGPIRGNHCAGHIVLQIDALILLSVAAAALYDLVANQDLVPRLLQKRVVHNAASAALRSLRAAASEALTTASETASGGAPAAQDPSEAAALGFLQQVLQAYDAAAPHPTPSLNTLQRRVLPPARQLAAALLDWWRRPSAQQEQQLEAAQAAAARSCAYLGCSNLGGSGGPAAGQGEDSKRCR